MSKYAAVYDLVVSDRSVSIDWQSCINGRIHLVIISRVPNEKPCDVLSVDYSGVRCLIIPLSKEGSRYFVTFIDKLSRRTVVFRVTTKSEVIDRFQARNRGAFKRTAY